MPELSERRAASKQRRALLVLLFPVVLFGVAWPVNKVALAGIPPLWFAATRTVISATVATLMLVALRQWRLPTRRDLPIIVSVGLLQLALYFALTNEALSFLPAGRSVVLSSTTTLWLVPLALLAGEPIPPLRWAGVTAGLAGILVLANPWSLDWREPDVAVGHLFLLLAALCWAGAIFHARHHRWELSPLQVLPWQMLAAAAVLVPLALLGDPEPRIEPSLRVWGGLFYIGVIAGPLASWAAVIVARDLPTVVSSVGFLGIPALGLALSTAFLGETLTWSLASGALLIGAGVVAATAGRR